ncbi:MAG: NAD-dependent epimerase/dehydratase family protein [Elusimicrobia bacterium]|nr:NAD-dependent epimerase/dehydratase family protein [Elusimicrobiota bacterium]
MRALVTGAAGFIGSNLCLELARRGYRVVGLDDFSTGNFENLRDFSGDVVAANLAQDDWQRQVGRVDLVFHQAAITDTTVVDQMRMMTVNVEAFRSLLKWASANRVKKVVYASSAALYGAGPVPMKESAEPAPLNVYAFSKRVMESVAREFTAATPRLPVAGLRYFNVFGPRERFKDKAASMIWQLAQQMLSGKRPRIFEFGEQYRDFIYVRDVVRANILAAEKTKARGVYNICTGKKTTFNEIIGFLNHTLGTKLEPDYFKNPYSFYQNETLGDPGAAVRGFGFSAEYSVERAIGEYFGSRAAGGKEKPSEGRLAGSER